MVAKVVAKAIFASSSSDSEEIIAQDADTEESDAPTDPELGRADYWTCIKCKNQKNNPMYRYCEKCYQVNPTTHLYTTSFFASNSQFNQHLLLIFCFLLQIIQFKLLITFHKRKKKHSSKVK